MFKMFKPSVVLGIAFFCALLTPGLARAAESPSKGVSPRDVSKEEVLLTEVTQEFQRHNYKKVIQLYRGFIDDHPDRYLPLVVQILYSQALADTGNIDEAIRALKDVLAELPVQMDPLKLRHDLANLLFLQRRFDEARTVYHKMMLDARQHQEMVAKAKERIALLKGKDANAKKKDFVSLQLLDIETALEAGEVPDGSLSLLQQIIDQNPLSPQAAQAGQLQDRIKEVRAEKAKAMLDEARRLYDVDKKYAEVREILNQIAEKYADVGEMPSIEALSKEVDVKLGKGR